MMVLCARALELVDKLNATGSTEDLAKFSDHAKVADYATVSVAALGNAGIITGNGNGIDPLGKTTRAEAAVIIFRIFNLLQ
ncbi:hypothetical protein FU659_18470 [Paenibacillus sp. N3.4]|nr:hypothetical protein FU659_18470 [Paenibacillus sp. N3.4]